MGAFPPGAGLAVAIQLSGASPSRTAVFLVDSNGTLCVFTVDEGGPWSAPTQIGEGSAFVPGSTPAVGSIAWGPGAVAETLGLFIVDRRGQLNLFWAKGVGAWQGPHLIGPAGRFKPGATPAAYVQVGTLQVDVVLVDTAGRLTVMWGGLPDGWNGPETLTEKTFSFGQPAHLAMRVGAPAPQTDLFIVDDDCNPNVFSVVLGDPWSDPQVLQLNQRFNFAAPAASMVRVGTRQNTIFLIDSFGSLVQFAADAGGAWSGPTTVSAEGLFDRDAHVAASQQFGGRQKTDVFAIDKTGRLVVFWTFPTGGWNGPAALSGAGFAPPTGCVAAIEQGDRLQTDVFLVDNNGDLVVFYVIGTKRWHWRTIAATATPPRGGPRGDSDDIPSGRASGSGEGA